MESRLTSAFKFFAVVVIFVTSYSCAECSPDPAIGGYKVQQGARKWQSTVYLHFTYLKAWFKVCGGILVSREWVLTAAHCVQQYPDRKHDLTIGIGRVRRFAYSGHHNFSVSEIVIHPNHYTQNAGEKFCVDYDIALVKLAGKAPYSLPLIPLAAPKDDISNQKYVKCRLAGWGSTKPIKNFEKGYEVSPDLIEINVNLISKKECIKRDKAKTDFRLNCGKDATLPRLICGDMWNLNAQSGCIGDSGSPLICNVEGKETLQGITIGGSDYCVHRDKSMRFAEISKYATWIRNTVGKGNKSK